MKQFKKGFQHNSMETRLADQQKHRLCSNFCKKISSCLLQNILSKVDKAEKTQVTNHDQEKPRHLFTFLPNPSFPQSKNEGMVSLTYIYFATNSFKMTDLIAVL